MAQMVDIFRFCGAKLQNFFDMCKFFCTFAAVMKSILFILAFVTTFIGRVVDQKGDPVPYATVYPEIAPEWGTATNNDGSFAFEANLTKDSRVVVSFIGYEKQIVLAEQLMNSDSSLFTITLHEQPIALEETVVAAKAHKQRNKRKQMAELLHAVYVKLEDEFAVGNTRYNIVSDVRMNSEGCPWGMEQMIATVVVLPEAGAKGRDSVQFKGRYCKRFFDADKRKQTDSLLAGDAIEKIEKKSNEKFIRKAANAIDSGVVVHRALFAMGNMRYNFAEAMGDLKHWRVSNESEGETVLTHTEKVSRYAGFFKLTFQRHYIVDSKTYSVRRFSEHADVKVTIPFGIKLNAEQLQLLNLVNMDEKRIEKFRLRKLRAAVDLNTIYQRGDGLQMTGDGKVYTLEKNMVVDAHIIGSKKAEIPLVVKATQRVTGLETEGVKPMKASEITKRMKREIVEIY